MRTDKVPLPAADLIVVDEAHHCSFDARTSRLILEALLSRRAPSWTRAQHVSTTEGRGLGNFFDKIIEGPSIPELVKQEHLVPTIYYAPTNPDLKGVETRQGDYVVSQLAERG